MVGCQLSVVGYAQNAYLAELGQNTLHPLYMDIGILRARAVAQINRELKHCETIGHQPLAEIGVYLLLLLGFGRQIEQNKHPHNPIFAETFHQTSITG